VFEQPAALFDLPNGKGAFVAVHHFPKKTRPDLFGWDVGEILHERFWGEGKKKSFMRMIGNYAHCLGGVGDECRNSYGVVDKWIRFAGRGGFNVVDLFKFESDETSINPDRGRGDLFFLYGAGPSRFDGAGGFCSSCGFGGACGFCFAYPDPGGAFCGCDRCRFGGSPE